MPRVCDSYNGAIDYCLACMPSEDVAILRHKRSVPNTTNDGRGCCFYYMDDHPEYDGSGYTCEDCGVELTDSNA